MEQGRKRNLGPLTSFLRRQMPNPERAVVVVIDGFAAIIQGHIHVNVDSGVFFSPNTFVFIIATGSRILVYTLDIRARP